MSCWAERICFISLLKMWNAQLYQLNKDEQYGKCLEVDLIDSKATTKIKKNKTQDLSVPSLLPCHLRHHTSSIIRQYKNFFLGVPNPEFLHIGKLKKEPPLRLVKLGYFNLIVFLAFPKRQIWCSQYSKSMSKHVIVN